VNGQGRKKGGKGVPRPTQGGKPSETAEADVFLDIQATVQGIKAEFKDDMKIIVKPQCTPNMH